MQLTGVETCQYSLSERGSVSRYSVKTIAGSLRAAQQARERPELAFRAFRRAGGPARGWSSSARRSLVCVLQPRRADFRARFLVVGARTGSAAAEAGRRPWRPMASSASRRSIVRASEDALLQARRVRMIIARRAAGDAGRCHTRCTYAISARCICSSASVGRTRSQRVRRRVEPEVSARVRRNTSSGNAGLDDRPRTSSRANAIVVAGVRRGRQHHDRPRPLRQQRGRGVTVRLPGDAMRFVDDEQVPDQWLERADDLRPLDVVRRREDRVDGRPTDLRRQRAAVAGATPSRARPARGEIVWSARRATAARSPAGQSTSTWASGATRECFRDDQACLHRLAETHLVGNQNSCGQSADERERRLELIGKDGDVGVRRRAQRVDRRRRLAPAPRAPAVASADARRRVSCRPMAGARPARTGGGIVPGCRDSRRSQPTTVRTVASRCEDAYSATVHRSSRMRTTSPR